MRRNAPGSTLAMRCGQLSPLGRRANRHLEQEANDTLARGLDQQHPVILHAPQFMVSVETSISQPSIAFVTASDLVSVQIVTNPAAGSSLSTRLMFFYWTMDFSTGAWREIWTSFCWTR